MIVRFNIYKVNLDKDNKEVMMKKRNERIDSTQQGIAPVAQYKIGETTYVVNRYFTGKQTLEEAIVKLILKDIKKA
jgi:hypothetical protein